MTRIIMIVGDVAVPNDRFPEGRQVNSGNGPEVNEAAFIDKVQGAGGVLDSNGWEEMEGSITMGF
jgi:hypothetical protein